MAANKLTIQVKAFIVMQLATWETPSAIKAQVKELFDVDITVPGVMHYDAGRSTPGKRWIELFQKTRADFLADVTAIPIANKSFRLRELNELYLKQKRRPEMQQNPVEMRAALEQAAKESGGAFTNKSEVTGKDGKALIPKAANVVVYIPDNGRGDA